MKGPLEFLPARTRRPLFLALLIWTLALFAVMQVLNQPLLTPKAPSGIVSLELAGTPERAGSIVLSWSSPAPASTPYRPNLALLLASFGLGLDYLFMPSYALSIALGAALVTGRHRGVFAVLGPWAGWGGLAAALFDATENIALFMILKGDFASSWPAVAFWCASLKFALILAGIAYVLSGALLPVSADT